MTWGKLTNAARMAPLVVLVLLCGAPTGACAASAASPPFGAEVPPPPGIPSPDRPRAVVTSPTSVGSRERVDAARSTAWQRALDEARRPHVDDVVKPRPLALVVGVVWLVLATRFRARARRRRRRAAR